MLSFLHILCYTTCLYEEKGARPMKKDFVGTLPRNRFLRGCHLLISRYFQHDVGRESAALAYYLLFAMFPFMIFLTSLIGLLDLDVAAILRALSDIVPKEVVELIGVYLSYVATTSSSKMLWFGLVFSVYFPMRAANSLMRSVRKAYHLPPPSKALRHQIKTLLYTICFIVTIVVALTLLTVGDRVLSYLSDLIQLPQMFVDLWTALRFPALGVMMFFALSLLYALSQDQRRKARDIFPGVAVSLAVWMVLSLCFSFYVENFASYSVIYGSIGAVIVLMIWLYMSATTLVMGAEYNGVLISLRKDKAAQAAEECQ